MYDSCMLFTLPLYGPKPHRAVLFCGYLLLVAVALFIAPYSLASPFAGHPPYQIYEGDSNQEPAPAYKLLFTKDHKPSQHTLTAIEQILDFYEHEFGWRLDTSPALILSSLNHQKSNAYATTRPTLLGAFFAGAAHNIDYMSTSSWLYLLLVHEIAHIYQLNLKSSKVSRVLFRYFGANPLGLLPLIEPNASMPKWLLEGNATYHESRFGIGGRLHSGHTRAVVYSLVANQSLSLQRLMNTHREFPFVQEKYLLGAMFFKYLADVFGSPKAHGVFKEYSKHIFYPYRLGGVFKKTFGLSLKSIWANFLKQTMPLALKQKQATTLKPVARSINSARMQKHKNEVLFLSQANLRAPFLLNRFNIETQTNTKTPSSLPVGKVFRYKNTFLAASNQYVGVNKKAFGLFGKKAAPKQFLNKFVYDHNGTATAYSDVSKALTQPALYVMQNAHAQPFGTNHSSAILNQQNEPIFFRQQGLKRFLHVGNKAVWSFKGFYAFPVDCTKEYIYFIASTPYGSGLFAFNLQRSHTLRVMESDLIVDAKHLGGEQFLINEVGPSGYNYYVARASKQKKLQEPYFYKDIPIAQPLHKTLAQEPKGAPKKPPAAISQGATPDIAEPTTPPLKTRPYKAREHLRFMTTARIKSHPNSEWRNTADQLLGPLQLVGGAEIALRSLDGFIVGAQVNSSDPLEYQKLQLWGSFYKWKKEHETHAHFSTTWNPYNTYFRLGGSWKKGRTMAQPINGGAAAEPKQSPPSEARGSLQNYQQWGLQFSVSRPLWQWPQGGIVASLGLNWYTAPPDSIWDYELNKTHLTYSWQAYSRPISGQILPWRSRGSTILARVWHYWPTLHQKEHEGVSQFAFRKNFSLGFLDFGSVWLDFLQSTPDQLYAGIKSIAPSKAAAQEPQSATHKLYSYSMCKKCDTAYNNLMRVGVEIGRSFETAWYSASFPISVRQQAVSIGTQSFRGSTTEKWPGSNLLTEVVLKHHIELLWGFKSPFSIYSFYAFNLNEKSHTTGTVASVSF